MVLSIVSALFALTLIVYSSFAFDYAKKYTDYRKKGLRMFYWGFQIFIGLLQGVVAITTAAFSCRAVCCGRKQHPGAVI